MAYDEEIQNVIYKFPSLKYYNSERTLKGKIFVNHTYCDEHIIATYEVEIRIPISYPNLPPVVTNISKKVPYKFGHVYTDGTLCLATNADQLIFLIDGNGLCEWIDCYVIPYYFAVEYYKKYGTYPFGERSHGANGKLEYYREIFKVNTLKDALVILSYIVNCKYRGHSICPCGSGKKLRNCHKDIVAYWKQDKYKEILQFEYKSILKEKTGGNCA